jgi:hypothetical protein
MPIRAGKAEFFFYRSIERRSGAGMKEMEKWGFTATNGK